MKYKINKTNYRNFSVFADNRLPHRSYFIPFSTKESMDACEFLTERAKSDAALLLSGDWDFKYYKSASQLKKEIDTDKVDFDTVHVPSTWQKTGYDTVNYLNSRYPFPCVPPKTPKNCPVGLYRKKFTINKKSDFTYIITFLGAIASLDVYLNGKYIGYGEGAHNSREFDITSALLNGENELVAVVYKWSTGTYLECQDMFRENGIFRDVYITENPESYIYDFEFKTEKAETGYNAELLTDIKGSAELKAELLLNGEPVAEKTSLNGEKICFENLSVTEWNAEAPVCYDLILTLSDGGRALQYVRQKVGFRDIKIDGCRYYFNGKLIKLKGVNHHDTHPLRGYAMTAQDLKKDVELMKEYNVNCIRTSHYPPDPILMTLSDVYGIYVVDEADIETHGTFIRGNSDLISDDPKWEKHYLDRVSALFERDKNHTSVVMWSMGNEAGGIKNFDACYEYLKTKSPIPVHYEPACRSKRIRYDIMANFYTSPDDMRAISRGDDTEKKKYDAPFFLCEYAHSMGVGPGGLDEYWDVIYSDDRFLGGCIWEWADHAHYDEKAKYKWTYGGDNGDRKNDRNFCCDGLFYPDRTPSTSAYCMKNVYSPLRASLRNGEIYIKNTNSFLGSENIKISYYLLKNGEAQSKTDADLTITAGEETKLPVKLDFSENDDAFVIFEYTDKKSGALVSKEQIVLNEHIEAYTVNNRELKNTAFSWDGKGRLASLKNGNTEMLADKSGFVPMLYQAVIDNHVYVANALKKAGMDKLYIDKQKARNDEFKNTVASKFFISAGSKKKFKAEIKQRAVSENELLVTFSLTGMCKKPVDLLQTGLVLTLDGRYENVRYYGMGDLESYSDFKAQDVMGVYETTVKDMYVSYIKPQESGNRTAVRWAELTDKNGSGLRITAIGQPLEFKAVDVREKELRKARHIEDVVHRDETALHISGFMRGIGSQSCGPDTADKFRKLLHLGETYSYTFKIEII